MRTARETLVDLPGREKPMAVVEADLSTLKRIERLPFSRFHWRLLWMGGLGYTFDAMDGAMIAFILPVVSSLWGLTNQQTGILGSSLMIGYLFGAFFAGTLGDLIGRRTVMMYALAIYCVGTLVAAFAQSWQFLFAWRVIASFGTGAESEIIAPFLAEFIQRKYRGRFVGSLSGFFSFGFVFAALLGYFVVPRSPDGWRIIQIIGAVPILMLLWWRRSLPESPRWLIQRERSEEAAAEVQRIEARLTEQELAALPPLHSVEVPAVAAAQGGTFAKNLAAYLMSQARSDAAITLAGFSLSFFMNGTYAAIYAYTPELYPTAFRTTGMGAASAFGRIGGLSAPIVIGYTFSRIGFGGVFLITTVVLVAGALAVALLGIGTAGKSLEQITRELEDTARRPQREPLLEHPSRASSRVCALSKPAVR